MVIDDLRVLCISLDVLECIVVPALQLLDGQGRLCSDHGFEEGVDELSRTLKDGREVDQVVWVASEAVVHAEAHLDPQALLRLGLLE